MFPRRSLGLLAALVLLAGCSTPRGGGGIDTDKDTPVIRLTEDGRPAASERNTSTTPEAMSVGYGVRFVAEVLGGVGPVRWAAEGVPSSWGSPVLSEDGRRAEFRGKSPMGTASEWTATLGALVGDQAATPLEVPISPVIVCHLDFSSVLEVENGFGVQRFQFTLPRTFLDEFGRKALVRLELDVAGLIDGDAVTVWYSKPEVQDRKTFSLPPPPIAGAVRNVSIDLKGWQPSGSIRAGVVDMIFRLKDPHLRAGQPLSVEAARLRIW